ncbi:hypothetical protein LSH36_183g02042 [Paralvinella palmiformis]|uniref:Uncharacterized protein n=1 Tax=Paralvinella palmiformis TaxID=53620 RepID=A0AAD9N5U9_9ANNE|nr:hypothetical protein LSH36_183g02042 [Paralvinella palmiformis]
MSDESENYALVGTDNTLPSVAYRHGTEERPSSTYVNRHATHPNYGTYLSQLRDSTSEHLTLMDNPVTIALHRCNERVLKPYRRLLLFVGWEQWFDDPVNICQKMINFIHPIIVMAFVLGGYVIQYAACFRRDSAGGVEVFLQTSPTQSGFLSQGRLIRVMILLLGVCVCWILLSLTAQIIHVIAQYDSISFTWIKVSFLCLDVVYTVVVVNYCVQCCLLVFYIEGLQEKLKQKLIELSSGMKEIAEIEHHLRSLNYTTAVALSIVLFNFGTMSFFGAIRILEKGNGFSVLMYISTFLSVIFWITIMILPVVQAARLSAACNSLRKVGHILRTKPFFYQNISNQELDSFLLYASSLNLRAKIFYIPVKTSYLAAIGVTAAFVLLLLFQTEVIRIWL